MASKTAMFLQYLLVPRRLPGQDLPDRLKIDLVPCSSRLKKPGRFFTLKSRGANDCASLVADVVSVLAAEASSSGVTGGRGDSVLYS